MRTTQPTDISRREQAKKLFSNGVYASDIAKKLNISRQRVHQYLTGYKSFASHGFSYKNYPNFNGSFCRMCEGRATHIHHIDKDSSNNSQDNLMPLCEKCHKKIHSK